LLFADLSISFSQGVLSGGSEIAVKRLSALSRKGAAEFRNKVVGGAHRQAAALQPGASPRMVRRAYEKLPPTAASTPSSSVSEPTTKRCSAPCHPLFRSAGAMGHGHVAVALGRTMLPLICSYTCRKNMEERKWFSAVKKVFSSSDLDGKETKVCRIPYSQEKMILLVIKVNSLCLCDPFILEYSQDFTFLAFVY